MATGDQSDVVGRIKAVLPARWFPSAPSGSAGATPVLDGILAGLGYTWSWLYSLQSFVRLQTRISTATGPFLDMIARDFFGSDLARGVNESDAAFAKRIKAAILQPRNTRSALIQAVLALTGNTPDIFEPANTGDTGAYGSGEALNWAGLAYNNEGGWGSLSLPYQAFVKVYPPSGGGVANIGGYYASTGWDGGGYGIGAIEYITSSMISGEVTPQMIYDTIAGTILAGTTAWTQIEGAPAPPPVTVTNPGGQHIPAASIVSAVLAALASSNVQPGGFGTTPSPPQNLTVAATDPSGTLSVLSWDPPAQPGGQVTYQVQVSYDGGTTWLTDIYYTGATAHASRGAKPGSTMSYQVSATNSVGTSSFSPVATVTMPTPGQAWRIESDSFTVAANAASGATVCNVQTNLTGTVTWSVASAGNAIVEGYSVTWGITSTGANTARITLASNLPNQPDYLPIAVTATSGTNTVTYKFWIQALAASTTTSAAASIVGNTGYAPLNNGLTIVVPQNLPLNTVLGSFNGSGGNWSFQNWGYASWWLTNSIGNSSLGLCAIEHFQFDGCRLILTNAPTPGTYTYTLWCGIWGTNPNAGNATPTSATITLIVLPVSGTLSYNAPSLALDNATPSGAAAGSLTSTLTSPTFGLFQNLHDRGLQYSVNNSGNITSVKKLKAGFDSLWGVSWTGGSSPNPATDHACRAHFRVSIAWATPTASDPNMVNGTISAGPTQGYANLSAVWTVMGVGPYTTKSPYEGARILLDAATYTDSYNDSRFQFGGYIPVSCWIDGNISTGSMPVITTDIEAHGPNQSFNLKSPLDIQNYNEAFLRNLAVANWHSFNEYRGIQRETGVAPGAMVIDSCRIYSNDTGVLNGYIGGIAIISNSETAWNSSNIPTAAAGNTHNIYFGPNDIAVFDNFLTHHAGQGHNLKCRAMVTVIKNLRNFDGSIGSCSFCLDFPSSGLVYIIGNNNVIHKGANCYNSPIIHFGGEPSASPFLQQLNVLGALQVHNDLTTWTPNNFNPVYDAIFIEDGTLINQGNQALINVPSLQYSGISSGNFFITQENMTGGAAAITQGTFQQIARPAAFDFTPPLYGGITSLPSLKYWWLPQWSGQQGSTQTQQFPWVPDNLSMPANTSGTIFTLQMFDQNGTSGPITAIYDPSGVAAGATRLTIGTQVSMIGNGATAAPFGIVNPASGLAHGTTLTSANDGSHENLSIATTGTIAYNANLQYTGPYSMTTLSLTVSDDSGGLVSASGMSLVYNGAGTSGTRVLVTVTVTPIGTVVMGDGSTLKAFQFRFPLMLT